MESPLTKTILIKVLIFFFKDKIKSSNIHSVEDLYLAFLKNRKNIKINFERLKELKKKYTFFSGLNEQILSSQHTSTPYHDRFYYPPTTYEENLYWLILNYNKAEKLLKSIKPDYIFDLDSSEIQRTIINEIANYENIPYITQEHSRYKNFIIPTFSIGRQLDSYFVNFFNRNRKSNKIELKKYIYEVENYRIQSNIMSEIYVGDNTSVYDFNLKNALKLILSQIFNFFKNQIYSFKNNKYKIKINSPLISNPYKRIYFLIVSALKKLYLYSKFNTYFENPKNEKYIYMPLHLIPESSTLTKAPLYLNEISIIEAVSKSLPINWKLYVKEHQSMIGERSLEFYKRINKFPNVKVVKPNFYKDPKPWIEKSLGVVTITGTSAFEASMLNKPAIVFGNVFFNVISSIKVTKSFDNLKDLFNIIETNNFVKDNLLDCAIYLKTINEVGVALNVETSLIPLAHKKILLKQLATKEENDIKIMIQKLIQFYEKALSIRNK